ncbi:hypothetical protein [Oceanobacillus oncorhynchi]|uniref:hypothetical protein n=1 Tax=Oceanobacillus oncorhynchi TaxID=545501 RepID=UPI0034D44B60
MITKDIYANGVKYKLVLETDKAPYRAELYKRELYRGEEFISQNHFMSIGDVSKHLRNWILSAINQYGREEVFESIREWDGVIE